MPDDLRRFQFGAVAVQLCTPQERTAVPARLCVPPSCSNSICYPGGRTFAIVRFPMPGPDPLPELRRMLEAIAALELQPVIVAEESDIHRIEQSLGNPRSQSGA
jgi:hypothetical protein